MNATRMPAPRMRPSQPLPAHDERDDEDGDEADMPSDYEGGSDEDDGDEDDEDDEEGNGNEDAPVTTPTGRWAFMGDFVEEWFESLKFADAPTSTIVDPRFGTFLVHLPWVAMPDGDVHRRELLYATELVAYMLELDQETWWYAKTRFRPWFEGYDPTQYDPIELVPTMTFALSQMMGSNDDQPDAVQRLYAMLMDSDTTSPEYAAYATAKKRLLEEEDPNGWLRGFQIPLQIKLQPPKFKHADALRSYLRDAVKLVRDFCQKYAADGGSSTPFRFDGVTLNTYIEYCGDVHAELRELLSLGVPIAITLRHGVGGGFAPDTLEWFSFESGNLYPAFAQNPADLQVSLNGVAHIIDSTQIANSYELWSALAYAPSVEKVCIQPTDYDNPELYQQLARWLGFGLTHSRALRSLEIVRFRMTKEELDALEMVLADPVPSSLIPSTAATKSGGIVKLISLKPGTLIECHPGGKEQEGDNEERQKGISQTLAQLHIPSDWQFPVVQTIDATQRIEFIVPGHAICAVPLSSVASSRELPSRSHESQLTSLVLHNEVDETGIAGRFVRLVGRNLRELHWHGDYYGSEHGIVFDEELQEIVGACPQLETLAIQDTKLESIVPVASLRLRELSLIRVRVPMAALVAFFQLLEDTTTPIGQTLQRFTHYCPSQLLSMEAVDAAVHMLATNHRLYSLTLGLEDEVMDANHERLEPATQESIVVERLPLASKLAFLSVVQHYATSPSAPAHPLGLLDSGCIARVFQWFVQTAPRRIKLLRDEE